MFQSGGRFKCMCISSTASFNLWDILIAFLLTIHICVHNLGEHQHSTFAFYKCDFDFVHSCPFAELFQIYSLHGQLSFHFFHYHQFCQNCCMNLHPLLHGLDHNCNRVCRQNPIHPQCHCHIHIAHHYIHFVSFGFLIPVCVYDNFCVCFHCNFHFQNYCL